MEKGLLKKFAIESRNELVEKIANKIKTYYLDEEGRKNTKYSIKLFEDLKHFIETHTKEDLLNYRLKKGVTNE